MTEIESLKVQYEDQLLNSEGVQSVGISKDNKGNKILVVGVKDATVQDTILPSSLRSRDDVVLEEVGEFRPLVLQTVDPEAIDRKAKHRPVLGGISAGHKDITAGTTSYLLTNGSQNFTSSNNHVYANVNNGSQGDPIYQPGPHDGGTSSDQSATLQDYVPVQDGATVDLAWASQDVEHTTELAELTIPKGEPRRAEVNDVLTKSGRTTGVTEGTVKQVSASVNVDYGDAGTITMKDQILTDSMSQGGDSGSAVLFKSDSAPAGLLFAGSSSTTVINEAVNVESESGLQIVTEEAPTVPTANVTLTLVQKTQETGVIAVNVNDDSGSAVPDATVTISGAESRTATTDTNGELSFPDVTIGSYTVGASKDGYESDSTSITESDFN